MREPKRGGLDHLATAAEPYVAPAKAPFWATFRMFFKRPVLRLVAIATAANQFITYATGNFATLFLIEEKGMTLQQIALWYALLILFSMGGGIFLSGWLVDRIAPRDKRAYAFVPAIGLTVAVPFYIAFVWAPGWELAMLMLVLPMALNYFYLSPAVALVQEEVRPNERVLAGALLLLVIIWSASASAPLISAPRATGSALPIPTIRCSSPFTPWFRSTASPCCSS